MSIEVILKLVNNLSYCSSNEFESVQLNSCISCPQPAPLHAVNPKKKFGVILWYECLNITYPVTFTSHHLIPALPAVRHDAHVRN